MIVWKKYNIDLNGFKIQLGNQAFSNNNSVGRFSAKGNDTTRIFDITIASMKNNLGGQFVHNQELDLSIQAKEKGSGKESSAQSQPIRIYADTDNNNYEPRCSALNLIIEEFLYKGMSSI